MLKIKDNVDLKELEKFGFEYSDLFGDKKYEKLCVDSDCDLCVNALTREIYHANYMTADMVCEALDLCIALFDLIQTGLVEKV